jgi:hypothetical protein
MHEKSFSLILLFGILLLGFCLSCNPADSPPPVVTRVMTLQALDASCTEAWLKASTTATPATVRLLRDGQRVFDLQLLASDSLLIDEGLLPNHRYTYQLQKLGNDSNVVETSTSVQLTTMDTTSHEFSWQIDTLGVTSSTLYDVAIINDTLAYAVGEMYLNDSTGQIDPILYNLAVWNGQFWHIQRIPVPLCPNGSGYFPLRAISAFGSNDIWMTGGGEMIHWDGTMFHGDCSMNPLLQGGLNKIWGTSASNLYAVGNGGTIIHYNGSTWAAVESGTTLPIMDVYGARDNQSGQYEILCVAEAFGNAGGSKILSLQNNTAREVTTTGLESEGVEGIWFIPNREYISVGQGVWRSLRSGAGTWYLDDRLPRIGTTSISGQGFNDIVVCGAYFLLAQYNGFSWQTYFPITGGALGAVDMKNNLLFAVGFLGNGIDDRAIIIRGRR